MVAFDGAQVPEDPQGNSETSDPEAGVADEEVEWATPLRRRRKAAQVDQRSYIIWGVPPDVTNASIMLLICKPRGPLDPNMVDGIESRTKRAPGSRRSRTGNGNFRADDKPYQSYRYILMKKPNSVERLASPAGRFTALQQLCATHGWRAVLTRTYEQRQADRQHRRPEGATAVNRFAPLQGREGDLPVHGDVAVQATPAPQLEVPHYIQLGSLNVTGGLAHKIGELESYFLKNNYQIVGLSEVRTCKSLGVKGFEYYSHTQPDGLGGVGFLVTRALKAFVTVIDVTERDQLWIRISGSNGKKDLYICSAYLPQESATAKHRKQSWAALKVKVLEFQALGEVVVVGDLNAKVGRSTSPAEHSVLGPFSRGTRTSNGKLLVDLLQSTRMANVAGFAQPPTSSGGYWYTRTDPRVTTRYQIDYILVPLAQRKSHRSRFKVDYTNLDTDHHLLHARIFCPRKLEPKKKHRVYKRHAIEKLRVSTATHRDETQSDGTVTPTDSEVRRYRNCLEVEFADYDPAACIQGAEDKFEIVLADFLHRLKRALDCSVGTKTISKTYSRSWYDAEVKSVIKSRRQVFAAYRKNRTPQLWARYKVSRIAARGLVRDKKKAEWEGINESIIRDRTEAPARMWKTVNRVMGRSQPSSASAPVIRPGNTLAVSTTERREAWADYEEALGKPPTDGSFDAAHALDTETRVRDLDTFEDIRRDLENADDNDNDEVDEDAEDQEDLNRPFSNAEIEEGKQRLHNGKASGLDQISNEALRSGGEVLDTAVSKLFAWFNQQEGLPRDWSRALIIYLYKSGDARYCSNYRGISLISCLAKWYLSIWSQRIHSKIEAQLEETQNGFRPGRGTPDSMFVFHETVLRRKRAGFPTYCFFIDFHKAFDTVWHDGLWLKLWDIGVRGKPWRILKKMYSNMQASVLIDGEASRTVDKKVGVRQGCPASPLLFNIFIDGLARALRESGFGVHLDFEELCALLYADDVVLLADSPQHLQQLIDIVASYCGTWRLTVNMSKSKVLVVKGGYAGPAAHLWTYNGKPLEQVKEYLYLGVIFTECLSWNKQVKRVLAKGTTTLTALLRVFRQRSIPLTLKRQLWICLCRTQLEYGSTIWFPNDAGALALESLQNKACVSILRVNCKSSVLARRALLGLSSLKDRRTELRLRYWQRLHKMPEHRLPAKILQADTHDSVCVGAVGEPFKDLVETVFHNHPSLLEDWESVAQAPAIGQQLAAGIGNEDDYERPPSWPTAITEWLSSTVHAELTQRVRATPSSTVRLLSKCPSDAFSVKRPFPVVGSDPSHTNFLRIRLLSGTHSLNGMMSRITRAQANPRMSLCQACNSGEVETVSHFLRNCSSQRARAARAVHEAKLGEAFARLTEDEQCIFILGGCWSSIRCDLKPTRDQDIANCELFRSLWAARNDTFEDVEAASPEEESDEENGGDPLQSRIDAYFARAEGPSEDDPSPATSPEFNSDSEVVSENGKEYGGDPLQPRIDTIFARVEESSDSESSHATSTVRNSDSDISDESNFFSEESVYEEEAWGAIPLVASPNSDSADSDEVNAEIAQERLEANSTPPVAFANDGFGHSPPSEDSESSRVEGANDGPMGPSLPSSSAPHGADDDVSFRTPNTFFSRTHARSRINLARPSRGMEAHVLDKPR